MNKKSKSRLLKFLGVIFILGGLGLLGYEIYNVFFNKTEGILEYCLMGAGGFLFILGIILASSGRKSAKNICLKCGASLEGCAYEWELDSVQDQVTHSTIEGSYYSAEVAKYTIKATCPECGKERVYFKEFTSSDYKTRTYRNPDKLINDWCKKTFGH